MSHSGSHSSSHAPPVYWPKEATLLLIELFKRNESRFHSGLIRKKLVWREIESSIQQHGHPFTWEQCEGRWKTLTAAYRRAVQNNRVSQFHKELSEVLSFNPLTPGQRGPVVPKPQPPTQPLGSLVTPMGPLLLPLTSSSTLTPNSSVNSVANNNMSTQNGHHQPPQMGTPGPTNTPQPPQPQPPQPEQQQQQQPQASSSSQPPKRRKRQWNQSNSAVGGCGNNNNSHYEVIAWLADFEERQERRTREFMDKMEKMHGERLSVVTELIRVIKELCGDDRRDDHHHHHKDKQRHHEMPTMSGEPIHYIPH